MKASVCRHSNCQQCFQIISGVLRHCAIISVLQLSVIQSQLSVTYIGDLSTAQQRPCISRNEYDQDQSFPETGGGDSFWGVIMGAFDNFPRGGKFVNTALVIQFINICPPPGEVQGILELVLGLGLHIFIECLRSFIQLLHCYHGSHFRNSSRRIYILGKTAY